MLSLRSTVVLWGVLVASGSLCSSHEAYADSSHDVHASVYVEAHSANRAMVPTRRSNFDSASDATSNVDDMPLDAIATTIRDCAFAGVHTQAHVDVEEFKENELSDQVIGVEVHIDMFSVLFPYSRYYDRSAARATASVEFNRHSNSDWGFEWQLGGRLAPSGWREEGEHRIIGESGTAVVLERFISGSSDGGPARWETVVEFAQGDFPYDQGHFYDPELGPGRYRLWIEVDRADAVWPGDQIKQMEDGVRIKFYFE